MWGGIDANNDSRARELRTCSKCGAGAMTVAHITQHYSRGLPTGRSYQHRCGACRATLKSISHWRALVQLMSGAAVAQSKVTIAIGGAGCLCYLPTVLAQELGEYKKAGVEVELVDFKGGSQALTAVIGGSADVVSGYFDHCVNLAAKNQALEAFVVYDRYPGLQHYFPYSKYSIT